MMEKFHKVSLSYKKLINFILFLGLSLSSLYVFPSGLPQPSDFILLVFSISCFFAIFFGKIKGCVPRFFVLWFFLVFWVSLVSLVWAIIDQDYRIAFHALFYLYNFLAGFFIYLWLKNNSSAKKVIIFGMSLALFVSAIGVFFQLGSGSRLTGWFNNPNQLGYFSLVAICIVLVLSRFKVSGSLFAVLILGVFNSLAAASLAVWGGLFLIFLAVVAANFNSLKSLFGLVFLIAGFGLFGIAINFNEPIGVVSTNIDSRINRAESKIEEIYYERRYDRVFAHPQYWVLGAGESSGSVQRFGEYAGNEVHSSLGSLLLSYGFVPFSILIGMFLYLMKSSPFPVWLIIGSVFFYSLTHMGLRFTPFWMLLVVIYYVYSSNSKVFPKLVEKTQ